MLVSIQSDSLVLWELGRRQSGAQDGSGDSAPESFKLVVCSPA